MQHLGTQQCSMVVDSPNTPSKVFVKGMWQAQQFGWLLAYV